MTPATKTKAEYIYSILDEFWPVPDDLQHPTPSEAVSAAREVEQMLSDRMDMSGLARGQARCLLICATNSGKLQPVALVGEDLDAIITKKQWEPVAIAFQIIDVEKNGYLLQTHVFEHSERGERLLAEIHTRLALELKSGKHITGKGKENYGKG
jgi:hypothetical protein